MKIASVNSVTYSNTNCQKVQNKSFKGALLTAAMKEVGYPNTLPKWIEAWSKLLTAVKNEKNTILNRPMYNKLMRLTGASAKNYDQFFSTFDLSNYDRVCIDIVRDSKHPILSYAKNIDGCLLQFVNDDESHLIHLGKTEPLKDYIQYPFFRAPQIYMDFYNTTGHIRKYWIAGSDGKYYFEDGTRDLFGALKDFGAAMRNIFNS